MSGNLEINRLRYSSKDKSFKKPLFLEEKSSEKKKNNSPSPEIKMKEKKLGSYTFFIAPGGTIINEIEEFAEGKAPPNVIEV